MFGLLKPGPKNGMPDFDTSPGNDRGPSTDAAADTGQLPVRPGRWRRAFRAGSWLLATLVLQSCDRGGVVRVEERGDQANARRLALVARHVLDENLAAAVAAALPADSGFGALRKLSARGLGIDDLTGIGVLTGLRVLDLADNGIVDLGPLATLRELVFLDLSQNHVEDLTPLSGLAELQLLVLDGNHVRDISPLLRLRRLESVEISGNPVPAAMLGVLRSRGLAVGSYVYDSEEVPAPQQWSEADLKAVVFPDHRLHEVVARVVRLAGGEVLQARHVTGVRRLDLTGSDVTSLEGIVQLSGLQYLLLDGNTGVDLAPIGTLPNLIGLTLWNMELKNLEFLAGFRSDLALLNLADNRIEDLSGLRHVEGVSRLDLSRNRVVDLSALAHLQGLTHLVLEGNAIRDLSPLASLTQLVRLCVSRNDVSDLSPLAGLTQLRSLSMTFNHVSDLEPLTGLVNLHYLNVARNLVTDLSPLRNMTGMNYLSFSRNQVSDVSAILSFGRLYSLRYVGNPLSRKDLEETLPALEARSPLGRSTAGNLDSGWRLMPSVCSPTSSIYGCPGC